MKRLAVVAASTLTVVALTGCTDDEPFQDAPIKSRDNTPARVLDMPDGFSNVAAKCDGPNMVYVIYHHGGNYGSVNVVANDPRCAK